ncbi:hypothetical protein RJT34_06047 [Clitoria ternatea]|uniref:Uncharacterized protein n=1 Tax=Clitoria ternatea TaxID=43366 RepID=A0AAN9K1S7_CLITE
MINSFFLFFRFNIVRVVVLECFVLIFSADWHLYCVMYMGTLKLYKQIWKQDRQLGMNCTVFTATSTFGASLERRNPPLASVGLWEIFDPTVIFDFDPWDLIRILVVPSVFAFIFVVALVMGVDRLGSKVLMGGLKVVVVMAWVDGDVRFGVGSGWVVDNVGGKWWLVVMDSG